MAQETGWLITLIAASDAAVQPSRRLQRAEKRALRHLVEFGVDRLGLFANPSAAILVLSVEVDPGLVGEADAHQLPDIVGAVLSELGRQLKAVLTLEGPFTAAWHRNDRG